MLKRSADKGIQKKAKVLLINGFRVRVAEGSS